MQVTFVTIVTTKCRIGKYRYNQQHHPDNEQCERQASLAMGKWGLLQHEKPAHSWYYNALITPADGLFPRRRSKLTLQPKFGTVSFLHWKAAPMTDDIPEIPPTCPVTLISHHRLRAHISNSMGGGTPKICCLSRQGGYRTELSQQRHSCSSCRRLCQTRRRDGRYSRSSIVSRKNHSCRMDELAGFLIGVGATNVRDAKSKSTTTITRMTPNMPTPPPIP